MNLLLRSTGKYDQFVESLKINDLKTFEESYMKHKNTSSTLGLIRLDVLIRLCVLYNKPEFLKRIYEIGGISLQSISIDGEIILDLARAIGADQCAQIIEPSCKHRQDTGKTIPHAYKLYTECIKMSCSDPKFIEINVVTIESIAKRGYDIDDVGLNGKSPLHEAIDNKADIAIFEALIRNGADVDKPDSSGIRAFKRLFRSFSFDPIDKDYFVAIVNQFMKGNPRVDLYEHFVSTALLLDGSSGKGAPKTEPRKLHIDHGHDSGDVKKTLVTPILIMHGFPINKKPLFDPFDDNFRKEKDLVRVLKELLYNPRSLAHLSRNVLRRTFPGRQIVTMCNEVSLPVLIKDFILLENRRR